MSKFMGGQDEAEAIVRMMQKANNGDDEFSGDALERDIEAQGDASPLDIAVALKPKWPNITPEIVEAMLEPDDA